MRVRPLLLPPRLVSAKLQRGSGIGGLAGGVASGKTVGNCYVQLSKLSNQGGDTPAAGWLAGSKSGANFSTCHYMTGNTAYWLHA